MTITRNHEKEVVKTLEQFLTGGHAHATFEDAVKGLPATGRGKVPDGMPYSIWQLVEHIRITQWDILEFSRNAKHISPNWPDDYWPKAKAPKDEASWKHSLAQIKSDLKEFIALLHDTHADLYKPFAHGNGQHLLRQAILIVDHTSYHTGQIIVLRRMMGAWK